MKPAAFDYVCPQTISDALTILNGYDGDIRILAGGQSLVPLLNMRLAMPEMLMDIRNIPELNQIDEGDDALRVGATVKQSTLLKYVTNRSAWGLIAKGLGHVGHPQTRNLGTVGGSVAHADPSAELPLVLATLKGAVEVVGINGTRHIDAEAFFQFIFSTAIEPGEILVATIWPRMPGRTGFSFHEKARRAGDFAMVSVAAIVGLDSQNHVKEARLGVGGVASTPVVFDHMGLRKASHWSLDVVEQELFPLIETLDPPDDLAATAEYRRHLVKVLGVKALTEAYTMARGIEEEKTQ